MIYKLESIDRTISSIVRKLGIGNDEIPYQDLIEYIADALEQIGSYYQFEEKDAYIIINDYKGALPCDLHKVIKMEEACEMNFDNSSTGFYGGTMVDYLIKAGVDFESLPAYDRYNVLAVGGISKKSNNLYDEVNGLQHNKGLIHPSIDKITNKDYNENLGRITTAFRHGMIRVKYLAIPIDQKGFPMIPDDVSFRTALFWYCANMIGIGYPEKLKNPLMKDIQYTDNQWQFYCGQARANANAPDLSMTERIKNNFYRLRNTVDDDQNDYRNLGKPQNMNFDGRH
jgi:hypothetical protein